MRQRRLDDPERGIDIRLHGRVEILRGDVEDRLAALLPRGVADHDVETSEPLPGLLDQLLAEVLVAEVAGNGEPGASFLFDQRNHLLRVGLLVRDIIDGDVGTLARIGDRGGPTHARIAAGDQRLAPGEASRALVAGFAMIRARLHLAGEARPGLRLLPERRLRIAGDGIDEVLRGHVSISFRCRGRRRSRGKRCARRAHDVRAGYGGLALMRHDRLDAP